MASTQTLTSRKPAIFHRFIHGRWHMRLLFVYSLLVFGHSLEHIAQIMQVYAMHLPRPEAGGVLGLWYPQLLKAEILHFSYNLLQLFGLLVLQAGFSGRARKWWNIAIFAQGWHFFEHFLLQSQYLLRVYVFGAAKQTSFGELLLPRVELHFIYISLVTIPTLVAIAIHLKSTRLGYRFQQFLRIEERLTRSVVSAPNFDATSTTAPPEKEEEAFHDT